ncbi:hypothetical protein MAPG_09879 [Magnaporthiopsis poae ATCC 64411]|uniref:Apple domain-containing protein n=1 Tax=Magnaporthiopsis poae (strain ATCC 64411 / 73-15) TaxID=644358 RepID=A0A0C4EB35_MAGP6|nr:hypothetical protein MAPG_09879 [Magnaporthiopsis poae ATCC 64411]
MSDANGPQAVYMSAPEPVKHDHSYPQVHTATATQQDQGWWRQPPQQQQQHPETPSTTYLATSPPPSQPPRQDDYQQQQQQQEKPTAGRSRRPNWLLAAVTGLLGVIIGGAIVAGVLGSMLANRSSSSSNSGGATPATECKTADPARGTPGSGTSNGTSSTSTSSAPATTGTPAMLTNYEAANWRNVSTLAFPCPRLQGSTVEAMDGTRYRVECGIDSIGRGKETPFDMKDIQSVVAYSFEDCVRSCASFNKLSTNVQGASPAMVCRTVVWRRRMDEPQFFDTGGNCFLKNATRASDVKGFPCDVCMSGTLL